MKTHTHTRTKHTGRIGFYSQPVGIKTCQKNLCKKKKKRKDSSWLSGWNCMHEHRHIQTKCNMHTVCNQPVRREDEVHSCVNLTKVAVAALMFPGTGPLIIVSGLTPNPTTLREGNMMAGSKTVKATTVWYNTCDKGPTQWTGSGIHHATGSNQVS